MLGPVEENMISKEPPLKASEAQEGTLLNGKRYLSSL